MSTLSEIIDSFSEAQKQRFNQTCTSKIYENGSLPMATADEEAADDAAAEVNNLSSGDLENLIDNLTTVNLAGRPC